MPPGDHYHKKISPDNLDFLNQTQFIGCLKVEKLSWNDDGNAPWGNLDISVVRKCMAL